MNITMSKAILFIFSGLPAAGKSTLAIFLVQEKCGFVYSHTEDNKPVPLLNEVRTEHFTKITLDDWRKLHR